MSRDMPDLRVLYTVMHKPVSKLFITFFAFLLAVPAETEDLSLPRIVEMKATLLD